MSEPHHGQNEKRSDTTHPQYPHSAPVSGGSSRQVFSRPHHGQNDQNRFRSWPHLQRSSCRGVGWRRLRVDVIPVHGNRYEAFDERIVIHSSLLGCIGHVVPKADERIRIGLDDPYLVLSREAHVESSVIP